MATAMTGACCPDCRLRFSPAAQAHYAACPRCGRKPREIASLEQVVGFQLLHLDAPPPASAAVAAAVALPRFGPLGGGHDDR